MLGGESPFVHLCFQLMASFDKSDQILVCAPKLIKGKEAKKYSIPFPKVLVLDGLSKKYSRDGEIQMCHEVLKMYSFFFWGVIVNR